VEDGQLLGFLSDLVKHAASRTGTAGVGGLAFLAIVTVLFCKVADKGLHGLYLPTSFCLVVVVAVFCLWSVFLARPEAKSASRGRATKRNASSRR
jgi:O-antigen ligase